MANATKTKNNDSLDKIRADLLRPLPVPSVRSILVLIIVLMVLAWGIDGTRPSAINRVSGIGDALGAMGNLLGRMMPPKFEWAAGTAREISIFGQTTTIGWPIVVTAVFETIQIAVIGTLGAVLLSLPISLLAARNTSPHPAIYYVVRLILNFLRSIPELVFALLFVAAVGLGAFTGTLALIFGTIGSLSRLYAEAIEQIDPQPVMAVRATGAGGVQAFMYSVLPQALPLLISYSIVYFEGNIRHATILGYVGAGGVGYLLFKYIGTSDYRALLGTALALVVAVTIIDRFSSWLRSRFI
jgi:phosphonate transport system permease protein